MAYRISATTDSDAELLASIRDLAWKQRKDVSQVIREAFERKIHGGVKREERLTTDFPQTHVSTCPLCGEEKIGRFNGLSKTGKPTYTSGHPKTCSARKE